MPLRSEHTTDRFRTRVLIQNEFRATLASKTIITMLPSSPHVKQVYLQGIIPALKELPSQDVAQTLCIDSTTLDVDVAREIATDISDIGAQMVDAPVSGGKSISHSRPFG